MAVPVHMTFMSFDMDRPLNKAHSYERTAEAQLKEQKWDEAEESYRQAAQMMRKALDEVATTSMTLPLQMQAEKLEKMKDVIDIKRKEAARNNSNRKNSSLSQQSSPKRENEVVSSKQGNEAVTQRENRQLSIDRGTEISQVRKAKQPKKLARHVVYEYQTREGDTLLNPILYGEDDQEASPSAMGKKLDKGQKAVIEEYETRLKERESIIVTLMAALEDKTRENESLKLEVEELKSEVSVLYDRLEHYEEVQSYRPINFGEENGYDYSGQEFTGDMMASTLITQPKSYFEDFDRKGLELELHDAARDAKSLDERRRKLTPPSGNGRRQNIDADTSVQYEDLDDALNGENASYSDSNSAGSSQLKFASLAGLPPLSPVHFELDDQDNIITEKHGDISRKS